MSTDASNQQDPQVPGGQQTVDWENRYKGQVREYNSLQNQYTSTKSALEKALEDLANTKSSQNDTLTLAQTEAAQLRNELKAKSTEAETLAQTSARLQQQYDALEAERSARQKIRELGEHDVLPAVEAGFLRFESLEDEVVKKTIESFRSTMGLIKPANGETQKPPDFTGAAVPGVTTQAGANLNRDALYDWLMDPSNRTHAEFEQRQELYYNSIK